MLAELAAAVRRRAVSSEELVRRSLDRIERFDPAIAAVVLACGDRAVDDARRVDAAVVAGDDPGRLAGLPLLVKDNEDVEGLPTTYGSLLRADAPPATRDHEVIGRLRAAGAVVVGKTNLPEFAFEGFTDNRLFGPTRNPWAPAWTPGGSSGGSGAAIAAGLAAIATGTDGGGSIRIPAAFCGLAGLKPTNGLIGRDPVPSWIDLSTKGPMATSVADVRVLFDVMRGPVHGDPTAVPSWEPRAGAWPERIVATPRMCPYGPLPDGVAASWDRALATLADATGLPVETIDPPFPTSIDDDWYTLVAIEERAWVGGDELDRREPELTSYVRYANELAKRTTAEAYIAARRRRFKMVKVLDELLGDDAILASPTMCVEGFAVDGSSPGSPGGADVDATPIGAYNTGAANITGHPAISVPAGVSANGVPFGLMLTGPRFRDDVVLAVAERWEAAEPWPLAAPGYEPFS
ncbi:MAG TPA: amidase [Actinomycetota bacterium]|nr:amidase [Actinomycetota bacterium]